MLVKLTLDMLKDLFLLTSVSTVFGLRLREYFLLMTPTIIIDTI
jgi:hypothetical protein